MRYALRYLRSEREHYMAGYLLAEPGSETEAMCLHLVCYLDARIAAIEAGED